LQSKRRVTEAPHLRVRVRARGRGKVRVRVRVRVRFRVRVRVRVRVKGLQESVAKEGWLLEREEHCTLRPWGCRSQLLRRDGC
jgi:hypothetical protein